MENEPAGDLDALTGSRGPKLRATAFTTGYGALLRPIHAVGWTRIRIGAYAVYAVVLAWFVISDGIPTGRVTIALMIVSGLAISAVGQGWARLGRVILDWLPFTVVLVLYDRTRAVADAIGLPLHEKDVLSVEKWLFGGTEPTVFLQQHLYDAAHVQWYDVACTLVYTSHFIVTPVIAALLWLRSRQIWLRYISRVVVLSLAGLVTYCLFPQAPPWFAAQSGLSAPVERLSARGWIVLHLGDVKQTLESAQRDGANPVAAMPSLHTAFAVLVAITVITQLRSRWRFLVVLYPMAMGFTLVYCGEHYVLDLIAGTVYAFAVHLALNRWEAWRRRRRSSADSLDGPADHESLAAVAGSRDDDGRAPVRLG